MAKNVLTIEEYKAKYDYFHVYLKKETGYEHISARFIEKNRVENIYRNSLNQKIISVEAMNNSSGRYYRAWADDGTETKAFFDAVDINCALLSK